MLNFPSKVYSSANWREKQWIAEITARSWSVVLCQKKRPRKYFATWMKRYCSCYRRGFSFTKAPTCNVQISLAPIKSFILDYWNQPAGLKEREEDLHPMLISWIEIRLQVLRPKHLALALSSEVTEWESDGQHFDANAWRGEAEITGHVCLRVPSGPLKRPHITLTWWTNRTGESWRFCTMFLLWLFHFSI